MLNRALSSLILLLCVQSGNGKLDCSVPIEFSTANNSSYDTDTEGRYDEYLNALNGSLIERIRSKKPDAFYQNVVNNFIMVLCDVEIESERCVPSDSPLAAKNSEGDCITAADSLCPEGLCERTSNCYWNSVKDMENRTTRFAADDYANAQEELFGLNKNSYAGGILGPGAIGVIVSVVLLMFWAIFFVIRYMCCCLWGSCGTLCFLCSPIPKKRYKMCADKLIPILFYVIALAGVTAAASIAFLGNEEVSVGLSNAFLHSDGLVDDLRYFLARSRIPLVNINGIIDYAALDAKFIFDGTEYVTEDVSSIASSFLGFYSLHSKGLNESNALSGFESALVEFESKVHPISIDVQTMLDTLELDLYDQADTIEGGITSAIGQLDSFVNQTSFWQDAVYQAEGEEYGSRPTRRIMVMSIFLASFLFGVLGLLGIFFSKSRSCSTFFGMLKITGFFSALLGSIALIFASLFLVASFIIYDSCQILNVVTNDFEPFVGEKVAPGANAVFNDTNLAVAFNVTDKIDFQSILDEGLSQIENINITSSFELVFEPLRDIQSMISSMSDSALGAFNQVTSSNSTTCPFTDVYTKATMLEPWELDRAGGYTPYIIRDNYGSATSYGRSGSEDSGAYLDRIYNKAGTCSANACCIVTNANLLPTTCISNPLDDCDYGDDCVYSCLALKDAIVEGHAVFLSLYDRESAMSADLGVICPNTTSCPTNEFTTYSNLTLVAQLENYKTKISSTRDSLVSLASTSVGEAMNEIEDFLCNMNVSFVERRYTSVKNNICGKSFLGVEKLMWSLWALGISLELIAILSHVLSVRLSDSRSEKYQSDLEDQGNALVRADIY